MMEESKDSPEQKLLSRLDEHLVKGRLTLSRLDSANIKDLSKEVEAYAGLAELAGQVQADSSWVISMMAAGVSHDMILKVWDLKDQQRRDSKNPENPQIR